MTQQIRLVNLLVLGPGNAVTGLGPNDFNIFVDLTGLTEGVHKVTIQVNGPPNVTWKPDKSSANITIMRDNA